MSHHPHHHHHHHHHDHDHDGKGPIQGKGGGGGCGTDPGDHNPRGFAAARVAVPPGAPPQWRVTYTETNTEGRTILDDSNPQSTNFDFGWLHVFFDDVSSGGAANEAALSLTSDTGNAGLGSIHDTSGVGLWIGAAAAGTAIGHLPKMANEQTLSVTFLVSATSANANLKVVGEIFSCRHSSSQDISQFVPPTDAFDNPITQQLP